MSVIISLTNLNIRFSCSGECAMDLFIDPLNPFGKKVSSTLQSTLDKQKAALEKLKQERAEKRAQEKISYSDSIEMRIINISILVYFYLLLENR